MTTDSPATSPRKHSDPDVETILTSPIEDQKAILEAVQRLLERGLDPFFVISRRLADADPRVRALALLVLLKAPPTSIVKKPVLDGIRRPDLPPGEVTLRLQALFRAGVPEASPEATGFLASPDPALRIAACDSLLPPRPDFDTQRQVLALLDSEADQGVLAAAVRAHLRIGRADALAAWAEGAGDSRINAAIEALPGQGFFRDPAVGDALARVLVGWIGALSSLPMAALDRILIEISISPRPDLARLFLDFPDPQVRQGVQQRSAPAVCSPAEAARVIASIPQWAARLAEFVPATDLAGLDATLDSLAFPSTEREEEFLRVLGAHLGETIRSSHGGTWIPDSTHGVGLRVDGARPATLFPFTKARKRRFNGAQDGLVRFLEGLRAALGAPP